MTKIPEQEVHRDPLSQNQNEWQLSSFPYLFIVFGLALQMSGKDGRDCRSATNYSNPLLPQME